MKQLRKGIFYGQTNETIALEGITLTDTVYTHSKVDWHYHEQAYFTFILEGQVIEGNKKEIYHCAPGSLLFHNWQESHYNIKPDGFTRGFHVEIEKRWFDDFNLSDENIQGSINISNPDIKLLMHKIFRATKIESGSADFSVQTLLLEMLSKLHEDNHSLYKNPKWVKIIEAVLHDEIGQPMTLDYLSKIAGIHPAHLSRDFSKYFGCTLSEYVRKLKVQKALFLIALQKQSFTEIAYECGFSDQSHFIKCFREMNGLSPSAHLKALLK